MKYIIFKKLEDGSYGEKLGSYESSFKDDTSNNRPYLHAEPLASHFELPEGLDEECIKLENGIIVEDADLKLAKRQTKANSVLNKIRELRKPLLDEADIEINKAEDNALDATALRDYRKALRGCTDDLKKVNGDAKLSCENLIPEDFEFPSKPE